MCASRSPGRQSRKVGISGSVKTMDHLACMARAGRVYTRKQTIIGMSWFSLRSSVKIALFAGTTFFPAVTALAASSDVHTLRVGNTSLSDALVTIAKQAGTQISFTGAMVAGKQTSAFSGQMSTQAAVARALAGTGLSFTASNDGKIITILQKNGGAIHLAPIRVGGQNVHEDPTGPGVGYVATSTMSGTKTDTAITDIPNSIYIVTKQLMVDQQPQNVAEALRYVPGVYAEGGGTTGNGAAQANGGGTIVQRGFTSSQFIDGLMAHSAAAGETSFLDRIEVVNGPASVMYGQVTPGGMIGMTLKKPTNTPLHQVSVGFGNWGRYEATVDVSDKITKSGNVRYRIAAIGVTQGTQTDHVDYHRVGVLPSITWDIDRNTNLTLLGSYIYTPGDGLGAYYPALGTLVSNGEGRIARHTFLGTPNWNTSGEKDAMFEYQFNHKFNKFINFNQTFRWEKSQRTSKTSYFDYMYSKDEIAIQPWNQWSGSTQAALDTRLLGKFKTGPVQHTWVVGSDFRQYNYTLGDDFDFASEPIVNVYNPQPNYKPCFNANSADCYLVQGKNNYGYFQEGVYFQDQIKWRGLSVILGGREDWVNYSAHSSTIYPGKNITKDTAPQPQAAFTWRAGVVYNSDIGLSPYFSYSTSFIPQTGTNWLGQPFSPLTGKQMEAGLKYKVPGKDILITGSAFHILENHYLISDLAHNSSEDAGTVKSQGFEISANANITRNIKVVGSYTYEDVRYANSNLTARKYDPVAMSYVGTAISESGKFVQMVPRNMFNAFVDYTFKSSYMNGFGINGGIRYIGFTYSTAVESYKVPAFMLFDIGAHYDFGVSIPQLKGLKAQLAISNLTNKYYVTSCQSYQCELGQGRKVYGSITYSW